MWTFSLLTVLLSSLEDTPTIVNIQPTYDLCSGLLSAWYHLLEQHLALVELEGLEPSSYILLIKELYKLFNLESFLLRVDRSLSTTCINLCRKSCRHAKTFAPFCSKASAARWLGLGSHHHRSFINFCIYCLYVFPHCLCLFSYQVACNQMP